MKILTPGHCYELANFERPDQPGQVIQFIEKARTDVLTFATVHDGTTNEEVLAVLIDRVTFLNNKFSCQENVDALTHLQLALSRLNDRTRSRVERGVEGQATA